MNAVRSPALEAEPMQLVVRSRTTLADGIVAIELAAPDGGPLPPFCPGAHIDLKLGNGLSRSYSLVNDPAERERYVIAVNRDPNSRGGSVFVHDALQTGQVLEVDGPRNNFALIEDAPLVVLIAGGIGITPLYCMVQRLETLGRPWKLFYGARSRRNCAYLAELMALEEKSAGRVHVHFNDEHGGGVIDLPGAVATTPQDAHLYCCGPVPMLEAFLRATADRAEGRAHVEYFSASQDAAVEGGFTVELRRSGRSFVVPHGKSILHVLLEAGLDVSHSCQEGVCGSCETVVVEGEPDHRDAYLTPFEHRSGKKIMICCSGCKSGKLVLDL